MGVCNVHERVLPVPGAEVGLLLDGLSGDTDRLSCTGTVARPAGWSRSARLLRHLTG
ncbi:hypothetical protein [Streptomyces sp. NRRL S-1813]|uniref:hypothetical protein n=1 Tax=Streptomyces sp. NRRL S-1813 TaxID=1463888 RepID=UPI000B1FF791